MNSEKDKQRLRKHAAKLKKIAPVVYSARGGRPHSCVECGLFFTPEDAREGRFVSKRGTCIRCLTVSYFDAQGAALPSCYGISYDGANMLCASKCNLRQACLIELSESSYVARPYLERHNKQQTYRSHVIRILKALGRPCHLLDLAPVLERETKKRFHMDPTSCWLEKIKRVCYTAPEIISLGENFFVWEGCWDISKGGRPGCLDNSVYRETHGHWSIEEILDRLEGNEE